MRGLNITLKKGKSYEPNNESIVTRIEVDSELYNMNVVYQEVLPE